MTDKNPTEHQHHAPLAEALRAHLPSLRDVDLDQIEDLPGQVAEALAILTQLLRKVDQTILTQLDMLAKHHSRIKVMTENLEGQQLLNIEAVLRSALAGNPVRMNRLANYCDLLLRWWSAVLAGVQSTILEVPHELEERLNPAHWQVEKKRWSAEQAAFWEHYKFAIRPELPLQVGDRLKEIQAQKTLDAYAIIGSGQRAPEATQDDTGGNWQ